MRDEAWVLGVGLFVAGALLLLAMTRFLGAVSALPAGHALLAIREGRPVADDEIARAVAAMEQSLRWGGTRAEPLSDLALLKLMQIDGDVIGPGESSRLLTESIAAQKASLALAPANADGWARLTYAHYALSGLDRASLGALAMSFRSGRLERAPMVFRLQLILREWDALDPEMRALGRVQIRQLASHDQRALDALTDVYRVSSGTGREIIRATLASSPEERARFERRLRHKTRGE